MSKLTENIQSLILRFLNNEKLETEKEQLDKWLEESELNIKQLESYGDIWETSKGMQEYRDFDKAESWKQLEAAIDRPSQSSKTFSISPYLRAAAIGLVLLAAGFLMRPLISGDDSIEGANAAVFQNEQSNESYSLSDNSQFWLKKESQLEVVSDFKSERTVHLKGEAFFEVQHDPSRKFVVKTDRETITVLGTEFSVNQSPGKFEVFVKSGKVAVQTSKRVIELTANKYLKRENGDYIVMDKRMDDVLPWLGNKFYFENTSLTKVLSDIASLFNVTIKYNPSNDIDDCKVTTSFTDESIDEIMEELKTIAGINYTKIDKQYSIESVSCN